MPPLGRGAVRDLQDRVISSRDVRRCKQRWQNIKALAQAPRRPVFQAPSGNLLFVVGLHQRVPWEACSIVSALACPPVPKYASTVAPPFTWSPILICKLAAA